MIYPWGSGSYLREQIILNLKVLPGTSGFLFLNTRKYPNNSFKIFDLIQVF